MTQPNFIDVIKTGRSLIVVPHMDLHERVRNLLRETRGTRACVPHHADTIARAIHLFQKHEHFAEHGQLLMTMTCANGFRVNVDRAIWVGPMPDDRAYYRQAMARGDKAWGQPAKWHYSQDQLS